LSYAGQKTRGKKIGGKKSLSLMQVLSNVTQEFPLKKTLEPARPGAIGKIKE